jgi:hypothetical protein
MFAAAALTACSVDAPTAARRNPAPPAASADLLGGLIGTATGVVGGVVNTTGELVEGVTGLLLNTCTPLQPAFAAKVIGPEGGVLQMGPHTLTIPPGAVSQPMLITGYVPSSSVAMVNLQPHGLQFPQAQRPTLTLSYRNCSTPASFQPAVAYVDDELNIVQWPSLSAPPAKDGTVSAWLNHFSGYVVAYRNQASQ